MASQDNSPPKNPPTSGTGSPLKRWPEEFTQVRGITQPPRGSLASLAPAAPSSTSLVGPSPTGLGAGAVNPGAVSPGSSKGIAPRNEILGVAPAAPIPTRPALRVSGSEQHLATRLAQAFLREEIARYGEQRDPSTQRILQAYHALEMAVNQEALVRPSQEAFVAEQLERNIGNLPLLALYLNSCRG
jgi:hypothetical protein